jgi:uncharacterized protein YggE
VGRRILAGLGTLFVFIFFSAATFAAADGRTIEVSGHGGAKARPDTMLLSFVVEAKGDSADESTNALTERAKALTDRLRAQVGDKGSVSTSDFSIENYGGAKPASAAWNCTGTITAQTSDLADVGKLVEAGIKAGAQPGETHLASKRKRTGLFSSMRERFVVVSMAFEVRAAGPDDCTRKAVALDQQIEHAIRDQLHGNGSVMLSAFRLGPLGESFPRAIGSQETAALFNARETVTVSSKDLGLLGPVIDAASKAGASFNSATFTLSGDAAARAEAIATASKDAQAKAAAVANSMGVKLGPVVRIVTNAQASPQVVYAMRGGGGGSASISGASPSLTPREVSYNAEVTVTYAIE